MKENDFIYLCQITANLTGVPVRLYHDMKPVFYSSAIELPKDPLILHLDVVFSIKDPVGYYMTENFFYYGTIRTGNYLFVMGPSREIMPDRALLRETAFRLDLTGDRADDFILAMQALVRFPIQTMLQILCALNFVFNGTKLSARDITISEDVQSGILREMTDEKVNRTEFEDLSQNSHNTLSAEQTVMDFIRYGNADGLSEWASRAPSLRPGTLSENQLRQLKNTFIVSATLASRAAIDGGMEANNALSLSDAYIQKCESLHEPDRIVNLQFHMLMDYATQVEHLRYGDTSSALVMKVSNYIHRHLSETIKTDDLADALFLSRGYLSTAFKKETGISLSSYIQMKKIEEANQLLRHTDKSLLSISTYLGFSSQSHFSSVFHKYEGMPPGEYREQGTH